MAHEFSSVITSVISLALSILWFPPPIRGLALACIPCSWFGLYMFGMSFTQSCYVFDLAEHIVLPTTVFLGPVIERHYYFTMSRQRGTPHRASSG